MSLVCEVLPTESDRIQRCMLISQRLEVLGVSTLQVLTRMELLIGVEVSYVPLSISAVTGILVWEDTTVAEISKW